MQYVQVEKKTTKRIIGSYGSHKKTTSTLSVNSPEEKKKGGMQYIHFHYSSMPAASSSEEA